VVCSRVLFLPSFPFDGSKRTTHADALIGKLHLKDLEWFIPHNLGKPTKGSDRRHLWVKIFS
jgi:hypothetical protein